MTLSPAALHLSRAKGLLASARALIFDVGGTLADTEEAHRQAFNEAFVQAGFDWCWGRTIYKELLRVAGGKERIRAFDRVGRKRHHVVQSSADALFARRRLTSLALRTDGATHPTVQNGKHQAN